MPLHDALIMVGASRSGSPACPAQNYDDIGDEVGRRAAGRRATAQLALSGVAVLVAIVAVVISAVR
jgi:hypothetical protein